MKRQAPVNKARQKHGFFHTCAVVVFCAGGLAVSGQVFSQNATNPLATLIFESTPLDSRDVPGQDTATKAVSDAAINDSTRTGDSDIEEYLALIDTTLEEDGLYAQSLIQQYDSLGLFHLQAGNYDEAVAAFEEALYVIKVNNGLFSLEQSDIVSHLVRAHTLRGDFVSVDNHKHYLYYLNEKSLPDNSPEKTSARLAWADWNVEAFVKGYRESYSNTVNISDSVNAARRIENRVTIDVPVSQPPGSTDAPRTMSVSMRVPMLNQNSVITNAAVTDYNLRSAPVALNNDMLINRRLHEAKAIYQSLLEQQHPEDEDFLDRQRELHEKLANINYLLKKELERFEDTQDQGSITFNRVNQEYTSNAEMMANRRYIDTRKSFTNYVDTIENSAQSSPLDIALAYISLGDMHMSFERPQRAYDAYGEAYMLLINAGHAPAQADAILNPAPDIAVPAYGIHAYSRRFFGIDETTDIPFKGHIDVSFDKDRFGFASNINILESTQGTPDAVRSALRQFLDGQRMRPTLDRGQAVEDEKVLRRYYYYY